MLPGSEMSTRKRVTEVRLRGPAMKESRRRQGAWELPWWLTLVAVGGLLLAIIIAGLAGLVINRPVQQATEDALNYDVEVEDQGDDLRVAILDLRQEHRDLLLYEPSQRRTADFEEAYADYQREIDALAELGIRTADAPQPEFFRQRAEAYYDAFRPTLDLYGSDQEAFERESELGLERIEEMEAAAGRIDKLGEELTADSLGEISRANENARAVLLSTIGGLLLAGLALAYLVLRVTRELRRLYATEHDYSDKLAEVSRAKTNFLADVSHELRTPLTVLRGNAELGIKVKQGELREWAFGEILRESDRMTTMVEDLLFLARSDSAAVPLEKTTVTVERFLGEVAVRASALAQERGAEPEVEISGSGRLEADQRRLEQVVLILVDNAAKYGPRGGRIRLSARTEAGELCLAVADQGPGIPEKDLPRIFERFYRLDKARSRKMGGSGLGLPIAKTIVEAHGGRLEAASRIGEGTTMTLRVPLLWAAVKTVSTPAAGEMPQSKYRSESNI